jgi:hypothetical protein
MALRVMSSIGIRRGVSQKAADFGPENAEQIS